MDMITEAIGELVQFLSHDLHHFHLPSASSLPLLWLVLGITGIIGFAGWIGMSVRHGRKEERVTVQDMTVEGYLKSKGIGAGKGGVFHRGESRELNKKGGWEDVESDEDSLTMKHKKSSELKRRTKRSSASLTK